MYLNEWIKVHGVHPLQCQRMIVRGEVELIYSTNVRWYRVTYDALSPAMD